MLLRDARGTVHDLGPSRAWSPSLMKTIGGRGEGGNGGWKATMHESFGRRRGSAAKLVVVKPAKPPRVILTVEERRERSRLRKAAYRASLPPVAVAARPAPAPKPCPAAVVRPPRVVPAPRPPRPPRVFLTADEKRARRAEYLRKWRGPLPLARCVYDGVMFEAKQPRRARYCSARCRGRFERESKAVA